jgi:hypothetical protein
MAQVFLDWQIVQRNTPSKDGMDRVFGRGNLDGSRRVQCPHFRQWAVIAIPRVIMSEILAGSNTTWFSTLPDFSLFILRRLAQKCRMFPMPW